MCGLPIEKEISTAMSEDNFAYISELKEGCIKGDKTKHISPKLFYTHDRQQNDDIDVQQICSSDKLADLFTKAFPTLIF